MKARGRLMRIIFLLKGKIKHTKKPSQTNKKKKTEGKREIKIASEQGWKSIWTFTTTLPMLDHNTASVI